MKQPGAAPSADETFDEVLDTVRRALYLELDTEARPKRRAQPAFVPKLDGKPEAGPNAGLALDEFLAWLQAEERERVAARPTASPDPFIRTLPRTAVTARSLGLRDDMTVAELRHIRRAFALDNHPDRFLPDVRAEATERMRVANALIDEAMRRARR